jgi:hypothetical protein
MSARSAEPLSEELEAKIDEVLVRLGLHDPRVSRERREILRAFAREILRPVEVDAENWCIVATNRGLLIADLDKQLLASQQSAAALAEALDGVLQFERTTAARKVLAAYRQQNPPQ